MSSTDPVSSRNAQLSQLDLVFYLKEQKRPHLPLFGVMMVLGWVRQMQGRSKRLLIFFLSASHRSFAPRLTLGPSTLLKKFLWPPNSKKISLQDSLQVGETLAEARKSEYGERSGRSFLPVRRFFRICSRISGGTVYILTKVWEGME